MSLLVFCVVVMLQVYAQSQSIVRTFPKYAYDLRFCPVLKRQTPRTEEGNGTRRDGAQAADAHDYGNIRCTRMSLDFRFNR